MTTSWFRSLSVNRYPISIGALIVLSTSQAWAQSLDIEYTAGEGCPGKQTFLASVQRILGRPLQPIRGAPRFRIVIEKVGGKYRSVVVREEASERASRSIAGADCSMVARATALSVVMALNNDEDEAASAASVASGVEIDTSTATVAPAAPKETTNPIEPELEPETEPEATTVDTTLQPTTSAQPPRVYFAFALPIDLGTLPKPSLGARLGLGVARGRWSGSVSALTLLPATTTPYGSGGARFWLAGGRVDACVRVAGHESDASLDTCAVFEAGLLMASGVRLAPNPKGAGSVTWLTPGPRLLGSIPLFGTRVRGVLGMEILIPFVHRQFTMNGNQVLHETKWYVGRADVGLSVNLQ